jgi:hypothetical protein
MSNNQNAASCGNADPTNDQQAPADEGQLAEVLEQILGGESPDTDTDEGAQLSADQDPVIADATTDTDKVAEAKSDDDTDEGGEGADCAGCAG